MASVETAEEFSVRIMKLLEPDGWYYADRTDVHQLIEQRDLAIRAEAVEVLVEHLRGIGGWDRAPAGFWRRPDLHPTVLAHVVEHALTKRTEGSGS